MRGDRHALDSARRICLLPLLLMMVLLLLLLLLLLILAVQRSRLLHISDAHLQVEQPSG